MKLKKINYEIKNIKIMKLKILRLFFPLWYMSNIKFTDEQLKMYNDYCNDSDLFIMGEDMVFYEYYLKTGNNLLIDTFKSSIRIGLVFMIILLLIKLFY